MVRRSTSSGDPTGTSRSSASSGVAASAVIVPVPRRGLKPAAVKRGVERAAGQVGAHHGRFRAAVEDGRLQGDRLAIGAAQAADDDDRLTAVDGQAGGLVRR